MMDNQLFSDEDAARCLQDVMPGLADAVKELVNAHQEPAKITRYIQNRVSPLIASLIKQAAIHYREVGNDAN